MANKKGTRWTKYSSLQDRFEDKFDKTNSCWNWRSISNGDYGYGSFRMSEKTEGAHRVSWKIYKGEIPEGLFVLHRCDNRRCVNPDHLFIGTNNDNMQDMKSKGRSRSLRGEESGNSKLTNEQTKEIRKLLKTGLFQREIAKMFGVSHQLISAIKVGDCRAHV